MERNLVAGLFHAAASLGTAESAGAIARRDPLVFFGGAFGRAGRRAPVLMAFPHRSSGAGA